MTRETAIANAERYFDSGEFKRDLARRVAIPTESQNPERGEAMVRYIEEEMKPAFEALGFSCQVLTHPRAKGPFLSPSASKGRGSRRFSATATAT